MNPLPPLALLLALQLCAPAAQVKKEASKTAAPSKAKPASARTIVCIDPGHPSEVASGKNVQNGTSENRTNWAVATKLRDELEARGYEVVMTKSAEDELVRNKESALVANRARGARDPRARLADDTSTLRRERRARLRGLLPRPAWPREGRNYWPRPVRY